MSSLAIAVMKEKRSRDRRSDIETSSSFKVDAYGWSHLDVPELEEFRATFGAFFNFGTVILNRTIVISLSTRCVNGGAL